MNPTLLQSKFNRAVSNPNDQLVLKELSVELGHLMARGRTQDIRQFRVMAANALRKLHVHSPSRHDTTYAGGVLSALLDAGAVAEETIECDQAEVDSGQITIYSALYGADPNEQS